MRKRFLTVIKNDMGLSEYDSGIEHSKNMVIYELPNAEFEKLYETGVFDAINQECGLLIDDYESEMISKSHLEQCINILEYQKLKFPVFISALKEVQRKGVALALDF